MIRTLCLQAAFTLRFVGNYTVTIRAGAVQTEQSKGGYAQIKVLPGPIANRACIVTGLPATIIAGQFANYTIAIRDINSSVISLATRLSSS